MKFILCIYGICICLYILLSGDGEYLVERSSITVVFQTKGGNWRGIRIMKRNSQAHCQEH